MALKSSSDKAGSEGSFSLVMEGDDDDNNYGSSGSIGLFDAGNDDDDDGGGGGAMMTKMSSPMGRRDVEREESLRLTPFVDMDVDDDDDDDDIGRNNNKKKKQKTKEKEKQSQKKKPPSNRKAAIVEDDEDDSTSSKNGDEKEDEPQSSKKRVGWFSRLISKSGGDNEDDDVDESNVSMSHTDGDGDGNGGDRIYGDDTSASGGIDRTDVHSTFQSVTSSRAKDPRLIETIPDCETEYHDLIRLHDWEELETLLKEYDYELYKKPEPKPKKKQTKKLRVAKYLPEMPKFSKEKVVPISPLMGLDALGRTPLHLCCVEPVPSKLLVRIVNSARDAAAVKDSTESLPIHLAIQNERSVEVVDNLVRRYFQGSWTPDGRGRTPLIWAVEVAKKRQEEEGIKPTNTYWGFPSGDADVAWQERQTKLWEVVQFLMKNRHARRKKLLPAEHSQIVVALGQSAPPDVISLMITTGSAAFKKESIGSKSLFFMISRQYPIGLLEKLLQELPKGFAKLQKDATNRGPVAAHYRVGCVSNQSDPTNKRPSFRVTMQNLANAQNDLHEVVTPSAQYLEWWEKLKLLMNLWGTHGVDADENDYFHEDELLLHSALTNSDAPPSLIQLLAALYPDSPELPHPKSQALPIHLACRLWRFRDFPPRRGEKEIKMDRVSWQLIESDPSRTRKRYKDRLPIQHAIATGKSWDFVKPLAIHDKKSLQVRDPVTKLYPFEMAAMNIDTNVDIEVLTRQAFPPAVWNKMPDYQQDHEMRKVEYHYDLEQLGLIFELLKHSPDSISHHQLMLESAAKRASGIQRRNVSEMFVEASDDVVSALQMKLVRAMFGLNHVSGHFIGWCYENTARGWKTHRRNFAVLKEAVMDGFVPINMDRWWTKLKFWLWYDCPWQNIPRRDEYLLHCALCNSDVSPWIIQLLLECFPRSSTIPLPQSDGCYPLHIACITDNYAPRPFEFPTSKTVVEMVAATFHDAMLLKWKNELPLHLAIDKSKQWEDIRFMAEDEPVSLAIPHSETDFFPFQFAALNRSYTKVQRQNFEAEAIESVGKKKWKKLNPKKKVEQVKIVLEQHEAGRLGTIFELLKKNPMLVSVGIVDSSNSRAKKKSKQYEKDDKSTSQWLSNLEADLSFASLEFLDEIYATENENASKQIKAVSPRKSPKRKASSVKSLSRSFAQERYSQRSPKKITEVKMEEQESIVMDDDFENIVYEEYEVTFEDDAMKQGSLEVRSVASAGQEWNEVEVVSSNPLAGTFLDHPGLRKTRRKDIVVVTRSSAFLVPKDVGPTDTAFAILSEAKTTTNFWLKTLKAIGEKIDIRDAREMRFRSDQDVISATVVGDLFLFLDEDNDFIWLLCGMDAFSFIEGYDIGIAAELEHVFIDTHTRYWLTSYDDALRSTNIAPKDDYEVLSSVLEAMEESSGVQKEDGNLFVSKAMFREAFGASFVSTVDGSNVAASACRKIIFAVSFEKLESRFDKLRPIPVRYQTSRALRFEVAKERFYQSQKKAKFLKNLKRLQRGAKRRRKRSPNRPSKHLEDLNQPRKVQGDDDVMSLATNDLFEDSSGVPAAKPLLTAAVQAREQFKQKELVSSALKELNQPRDIEDDNRSIDMDNLWTKELSTPPSKPLLAAAIVARENARQHNWTEGQHLNSTNQPSDDSSINSIDHDDLFDKAKAALPANPLLTAALKAREESIQKKVAKKGRHLRGLNQPKKKMSDDMSIGESDLFVQGPDRDPPAKPLLSAAYRAREMSKQEQYSKHGEHLSNLNQPKRLYEDANSIDEDDLFDHELRIMPPANALKAAAVRAKQQSLERKLAETHLQNVHQPSSCEDDNVSISQVDDLFDGRKDSVSARPLMAAALKAREQSKEEGYKKAVHLRDLNQPKDLDSDDMSIDDDIFDTNGPVGIPGQKPLLTAAYKAREQRRADALRSGGNGSNSIHLQFAHQPRSVRQEDDAMSLGLSDVFESSAKQAYHSPQKKRPLLQAAMKAKEDRDAAEIARRDFQSLRSSAKGRHYNGTGSSKVSMTEDSASLTVSEIFDRSKGELPKKPLLTAAKKAKEEREAAKQHDQLSGDSDDGSYEDMVSPRPQMRRRTSTSMSASLVRQNSFEMRAKSKMTSPRQSPSKMSKSSSKTKTSTTVMTSPSSGSAKGGKSGIDSSKTKKKSKKTSSSTTTSVTSPSGSTKTKSPNRDGGGLLKKRPSLFGRR